MDPARFEAMVKAIVGFELTVEEMRGTRKLGQHKAPEQRAAVADALDALGMAELAGLSRPISPTE
jgi:transcriptional regulator